MLWVRITVAQWLRCCATNQKFAGSIPAGVIGFFIDIKSFRSHHGPGVDSASNRNEYQDYFLGVKALCVRLTTIPPPCAVVTKSESLKFLEPSGPLQACNGIALPLNDMINSYLFGTVMWIERAATNKPPYYCHLSSCPCTFTKHFNEQFLSRWVRSL